MESVIIGMAIVGYAAICFVAGKYFFWPVVKLWIDGGLNGAGVDADEAREAEELSALNELSRRVSQLEYSVNGSEVTPGIYRRLAELEDGFSKVHDNLRADNNSISEAFKNIHTLKESLASLDGAKRLDQLERMQENLSIQFSTHRESFKILVDAIESTLVKKKKHQPKGFRK